jgi:hypothetical protein
MDITLPDLNDEEEQTARNVAHGIVRAFGAVDRFLENLYAAGLDATPDAVADELERAVLARIQDMVPVFGEEEMASMWMLLAEATDNLGYGEFLEPERVPAFHGPRRC